MKLRRAARERAIQFLFQWDLNPLDDLEEAMERFWETHRLSEAGFEHGKATWGEAVEAPAADGQETRLRLFSEQLIRGVLENRDALDELLKKHTRNWDLSRMAVVDRNVMRLGAYELLYREDIPPVVSINEAVDIAKRFSTQESGKFVNGILDRIRRDILRPSREPVPPSDL